MYSPHLHHLFVQAHIQELNRSSQASSRKPITTKHRQRHEQASYIRRAVERFIRHAAPEAPAF
jgi:hypothetical protein